MSTPIAEIATLDYFRQEYTAFRDLMCSRQPQEIKRRGLDAIVLLYLNLSEADAAKAEVVYHALLDEYQRRESYENRRPPEAP